MEKKSKTFKRPQDADGNLLGCNKFLKDECPTCQRLPICGEYLNRYVKIPHYVVDTLLSRLTPNEWKTLLYIVRYTRFQAGDYNRGKAFVRYADIAAATGIKQPGRCLKRLAKLGVLKIIQVRHRSKNTVNTVNTMIVQWPLNKLDIRERDEQPRDQSATNNPDSPPKNQTELSTTQTLDEYQKHCSVDQETAKAMNYFLNSYRRKYDKEHPRLTSEQWAGHAKTFTNLYLEQEYNEFDLIGADMEKMIDLYFEEPYDHGIDHFNQNEEKEYLYGRL